MKPDLCDLCSSDCRGRRYGAGDDLPPPNRRANVAMYVPIALLLAAALVVAYLSCMN